VAANPAEAIRAMAAGSFSYEFKLQKGSKGSGNMYLLFSLGAAEVCRLELGKADDWSGDLTEMNICVHAIMGKLSDGIGEIVAGMDADIAEVRAAKRDKAVSLTDGIRAELVTAKTPGDVRKIVRNAGFDNPAFSSLGNRLDELLGAADKILKDYVENA
jgi:hypothetical protein